MDGELHKESIFCDAQLLTTHTLSAKGPTRNCDLSICFGRASFVDRSKNCRKNNVIIKLFVWLLQRVAEMVRNLVELFFCKKKYLLVGASGMLWTGQWVSE